MNPPGAPQNQTSGTCEVIAKRVRILAYPPPTTGLYILFVAALLAAGMFVGGWLHDRLYANELLQTYKVCWTQSQAAGAGLPPVEAYVVSDAAFRECIAPFYRVKGTWYIGGAMVVVAMSAGVVYLTPLYLCWRKALSPPPPKYRGVQERFAQLAAHAGLRRSPAMLVGPYGKLGDAFGLGTPGAHAVAVPVALLGRLQRPGPGDGLLRHEFAHLRHGDVELAWLARSVWVILLPALAVPVAWAVVGGDRSLLADYLWRVALLAVVVRLISAHLLRSREHDADLAAADSAAEQAETRGALKLASRSRRTGWVRGLLARHPSSERRAEVLDAPQLWAQVNFVDSLTAGFLAAFAMPLIVEAAWVLFAGTSDQSAARWAAAVLSGSLLGMTVGFGLWRAMLMACAAAAIRQEARRDTSVWAAVFGTGLGLLLGQVASLAQVGIPIAGLFSAAWLPVPAVLCAAAVAVSGLLGLLLTPLARLVRHPRQAWIPAMMLNVVLFIAAIWYSTSLQNDLDLQSAEPGASAGASAVIWVAKDLALRPPIIVAAIILVGSALGAALLRRSAMKAPMPDWLYIPGSENVDPGVEAGGGCTISRVRRGRRAR